MCISVWREILGNMCIRICMERNFRKYQKLACIPPNMELFRNDDGNRYTVYMEINYCIYGNRYTVCNKTMTRHTHSQ